MVTDQEDVITEPRKHPGVGASLSAARQAMGKDLVEVAQQLRIRQAFLAALEEGRHKDLPGGTYAIGFLRTYAEFLGLDGDEILRRFKQEAASDLNARAELVFPSPVSEGRIPGGAVIFVGVLLAALGYGAWYWTSSRDAAVAEMVPPVPERMAGPVAEQPKAEQPAPEAAKPTTEVQQLPAEDDKAATAEPAQQAAAPEPVTTTAAAPTPEEPAKTPEPEAAAPTPATTPAPPATEEAAPPQSEATVIGQDNAGSRITLRAAGGDCWVQVRELDGQLLLSRLLRKGDSYMVPNRPGLSLMVGNAGALEVTVDGKAVPSLGALGQVRRDIKLEAEALLPSATN